MSWLPILLKVFMRQAQMAIYIGLRYLGDSKIKEMKNYGSSYFVMFETKSQAPVRKED